MGGAATGPPSPWCARAGCRVGCRVRYRVRRRVSPGSRRGQRYVPDGGRRSDPVVEAPGSSLRKGPSDADSPVNRPGFAGGHRLHEYSAGGLSLRAVGIVGLSAPYRRDLPDRAEEAVMLERPGPFERGGLAILGPLQG